MDPRIPRAVAGDRAAAQELIAELLPRVGNLVRYLIGGDSEVEDISQRVLIELLRGLHTYRGESKLTAWTDRITVRTTLSYVKQRRNKSTRQQAVSTELFAIGDSDRAIIVQEKYLARREAARALDELPEDQRTAVVLHYIVGLSVPELAEQLGVPFETIRSRLRIAMQKLRSRFGIEQEAP